MTHDTEIPTLTDIEDSKKAMDDIQSFTYSSVDSFVDANSVIRDTVSGRLKKMGYDTPIPYTGAISFTVNDNTKTVEEDSIIYAPKPSSLPLTTSGTFIGDDDARFFVVQGLTENDLNGIFNRLNPENIANLRATEPDSDGEQVRLLGHTVAGVGGGVFYFDASDTTSADNNGTVIVTTSGARWKRPKIGFVTTEQFGCVDGPTLNAALTLIQSELASIGGKIVLTLSSYTNIAEDIVIIESFLTFVMQSKRSKLVFNSGFGFSLGISPLGDADKTNGTKVTNTTIYDMVLDGEKDYNGDILTIAYADETNLYNVISAPTEVNLASGSLVNGLKLNWVQWLNAFGGRFGGNKSAMFINFTNHGQDNEDHFHFYGTKFYVQKDLIVGVPNASIYVFFENGRSNGASEVSFNGVHIGEFASPGADTSNNYGVVTDLDGVASDKAPINNWGFNDCMFESSLTMFDTKTLNIPGAGKDVSLVNFDRTFFVGNNLTDTLWRADNNKAEGYFTSGGMSAITTIIDSNKCHFAGRINLTNFVTFSVSGLSNHSWDSWRPIKQLRVKRRFTDTLLMNTSSLVVAHGLTEAPNIVIPQFKYQTTHTITSIDDTNFTITVGTQDASDQSIDFYVEIGSSQ